MSEYKHLPGSRVRIFVEAIIEYPLGYARKAYREIDIDTFHKVFNPTSIIDNAIGDCLVEVSK